MIDKFFKIALLKSPSKQQRLSLLRFYNRNFPKSKWSERGLERYFSDKKRHPICIIIKFKSKIIGLIMGRLSSDNKTKLNLAALLVSRQYQGKGYSKILIREFFKSAIKIPSQRIIYLHFRYSNKNLKSFYKRFGFGNCIVSGKYSNGEKKYYMDINKKSIQEYLKNL